MIAVVGSQALANIQPRIGRKPGDLDINCTAEEFEEFVPRLGNVVKYEDTQEGRAAFIETNDGNRLIVDAEFIDGPHATAKLVNQRVMQTGFNKVIEGVKVKYADLNTLYELKMSHRFKKNDRFFLKTMRDIHLMRHLGATIENELFYLAREDETYNYRHPSLAQSKEDFFKGDGVPYIYDHDTIHQSVAHLKNPAYTYYKVPDHPVMCDRKTFFELPKEVRLYGVLEEAYVLALERAVIPHNTDRDQAFLMALFKVCTSITSGWFREYAWENYLTVREMYSPSYVDRFEEALAAGRVLPFTGELY